MIEFRNVLKRHGPQVILRDASFMITMGERVGIVGPNGSGKSTLFELIIGGEQCDGGDVILPKDLRLGYLRQQLNPHTVEESLLDYTCRALPELDRLHDQMLLLEKKLPALDVDSEERSRTLDTLGRLQHNYEHLGGYEMQNRAEAALHGLGFAEGDFSKPFKTFSGGWQMRAELVRTLISRPDVLLLDEPSNYLDLPAVEWLQRYLKDFAGTLLLVSHDRYLLESLTDITLEVLQGFVTRYAGGFSYYLTERHARMGQLRAAQANQDRKREQVERFIERFRSKNTKATQVQSRIKQLEKMETIDLPVEISTAQLIRIPEPPHSGAEMVRLEQAGLTYDGERWVLRGVDLALKRGDRTAVVGFNGMGKTTLLRLLAGVKEPSEGRRVLGHKVVLGYQSQEFADTMPAEASVYRIVLAAAAGERSEKEVRSILGGFGFSGEAVHKPCNVLSGGEKIRLAFARIFVRPPNLLILDEPTTHLDLQGREALESALAVYKGTVCLVSHDVTFVRRVASSILAVTPGGLTRYAGGYDYYREKTGDAPQVMTTRPGHEKTAADPRKLARQDRAVKREDLRRERMAHRKEVREAEKHIADLEREQASLVEQLSAAKPSADYAAINRRLGEIQHELEAENERWEQHALALEALDR